MNVPLDCTKCTRKTKQNIIPEEELHKAASQTKRNNKYTIIIIITPTVTPHSACIALVVNHSIDIGNRQPSKGGMCHSSWCNEYCWVGHHRYCLRGLFVHLRPAHEEHYLADFYVAPKLSVTWVLSISEGKVIGSWIIRYELSTVHLRFECYEL